MLGRSKQTEPVGIAGQTSERIEQISSCQTTGEISLPGGPGDLRTALGGLADADFSQSRSGFAAGSHFFREFRHLPRSIRHWCTGKATPISGSSCATSAGCPSDVSGERRSAASRGCRVAAVAA